MFFLLSSKRFKLLTRITIFLSALTFWPHDVTRGLQYLTVSSGCETRDQNVSTTDKERDVTSPLVFYGHTKKTGLKVYHTGTFFLRNTIAVYCRASTVAQCILDYLNSSAIALSQGA